MKRALLLMLVLLFAACAREGRLRVLAPEELPEDIYAMPTPTPTAAPLRDVLIFFVRDDHLEPVVRSTSSPGDAPEFVLRALLAGPSAEEAGAGLATAIPGGAELLDVDIDDGVASINLSKEFELSAEESIIVLRLGQVVYTLTGFGRVTSVEFRIDGEPVDVISEDGELLTRVGRSDYAGIGPREGSPPPQEPVG